jgi:hypothetical protein
VRPPPPKLVVRPLPALVVGLLLLAATMTAPYSLARYTNADASAGSFATATLAPPTGLSASGGASVALSWTPSTSTGAAGYIVERAPALLGPFAQIGTATPVTATGFTDGPPLGIYWYRVSTYFQNWRSATTSVISATVALTTSTGEKPCVGASNAADSGGNGNGYESNPGRACTDDSSNAIDASTGSAGRSTSCTNAANDRHRFWGNAFGLPGSVTSIDGITVRADVGLNNNGGTSIFCVQLSWDGGTSWTAAKSVTLSSAAEATYTLGSSIDTWGRTWTTANFSTANFRVRVIDAANQPNRDYRLDYLAVNVYYTP